jgi:hypothetical protein
MAKGSVKLNGGSGKASNGNGAKYDATNFFGKIIPKLRNEGHKGVHVVYGGLNEAVGQYYGWRALDGSGKETEASRAKTREFMDKAVEAKIIAVIPCRGGAMAYLWSDKPVSVGGNKKVADALANL